MTASSSVRPSTAIADPSNPANVLVPGFGNMVAITKSDSTVYKPPLQAIYVGGAGDVAVHPAYSGSAVTFTAPPVGTVLRIVVDKVMSTNTSATNLIGMW